VLALAVMSRITLEEVHRVARLARLSLADGEAQRLSGELDQILGYVETLAELDTSDIEPTAHAIPLPTPLREDEPEPGIDPELAVANAPEAIHCAFVVPQVIEGEEEG
jgi:aspartyl-tRNA(Asn)/glutamyl-tRNA(Gln) amidotransferase subunit C